MEEMNKYELFDAYLRGDLSGEELDSFVVKLKEDPSFKEEFDLHALLVKGIEEHRKQELKAFLSERTNRGFIGNPFGKKYTILAAAVLALFAVMYFGVAQLEKQNESLALKQENTPKPIEEERSFRKVDSVETDKAEKKEPMAVPPPEVIQDLEIVEDEASELDEEVELPDSILLNEFESYEVEPNFSAPRRDYIQEKTEVLSAESLNFTVENELPVLVEKVLFDTVLRFRVITSTSQRLKEVALSSTDSLAKVKKDANQNLGQVESALKKSKEDKGVRIEYWFSPINYTGFKFDGKKLVLYGVSDTAKIEIIKKEDANAALAPKLYLRIGNQYYELKDDNTYRPFKAIVDEKTLKGLK